MGNRDHDIRIACDTETLQLFQEAKAKMIGHLKEEPSNRVAIQVLSRVFLETEREGRLSAMLLRVVRQGEGAEFR